MILKDADKIKEAIKNSDDFVGGSDDIIKVIDSVPEVVINTDTDTISRKAAIDIISQHTFYDDYDDTDKCSLLDGLSALPYAQPERIKGHWIESKGQNILLKNLIEKGETWRVCDRCGAGFMIGYQYECDKAYHETFHNFCPKCGAEMEVTE